MPSGRSAEPGETFASTALGEALEETGVVVSPDALQAFACMSDPGWTGFQFPNGDQIHSFNMCFSARSWSGQLRADGVEASKVGFFDMDPLPAPMLPMSEKVLELYAAWSASREFQAS